MPPRKWRLLVDEPCGGVRNMAVDVVLLRSRIAGGPPTLRLYGWAVPTLSLGRFQSADDVDWDACSRLRVDVVRRPTGGRGVLHDDELTYSVTAAEADGVPRGVAASYRHLGAALVEAYRLLGVPAELTAARKTGKARAACYLAPTQADLSVAGAKLSGSAQGWSDGACLQHGSFVVSRDVAREASVLRLDRAGEAALAAGTLTIADALGERPARERLVGAVVRGFERTLGIRFVADALSADESAAVEREISRTPSIVLSAEDVGG